MRASGGQYYARLDHLRGFAAFMVYFWHFVHISVPPSYVPSIPPMSIFEEGYTGIALFMTLSGYLFSRIVGGRRIHLLKFFWNRFLRLAPLLIVVILYYLVFHGYKFVDIFKGVLFSRLWPGAAWSISVEVQFYMLFPLLMVLTNKFGEWRLALLLIGSILVRFGLWLHYGEIQSLTYWTMVGCIDYFIIGMFFAKIQNVRIFGLKTLITTMILFICFWHYFNYTGGFYNRPSYPSPSPLWIFLPTVQGLCWAVIIISYERAKIDIPDRIDRTAILIGTVSYSIYMLHFIIVFDLPRQLLHFRSFWWATMACIVTFPMIVWISAKSYQYIEQPFLRRRVAYTDSAQEPTAL